MSGPLTGIRVLDLGRYIAAPWAGQLLGDLGAEVIKIEQPGCGDPMRQAGPTFVRDAAGEPTDLSAYLTAANRNKQSLTLDITSDKGRDVLQQLITKSDVLLENFRPGYLEKQGLGFDALHAINPRLVLCSISGFGQDSLFGDTAATDSLAQAMSGLMSVTGEADGPPQKVGVTIIDVLTGTYAATAILAALRDIEARGGGGQRIDLSLFDTAMAAMSHAAQDYLISGQVPLRNGGQVNGAAPGKVFATADGWINVQAQYDWAFPRFCDALELQHLCGEPDFADAARRWTHRERLLAIVEPACAALTTDELTDRLTASGVMAAPVLTVDAAFALPHSRARGIRREAHLADGACVPLVANPLRLRGAIARDMPPPLLGQHSDIVLRDLLGFSDEEVATLRAEAVI